jgi:nucleoside-diphosphate-sugar epimerase
MKYSIYGATGFIGSRYCELFPEEIFPQQRNSRNPLLNDIIYFISTVDNYNIFNNITLDVDTNLKVLCEVLECCKERNVTFNFISSWFVYGETKLPAKEDYNCNPTGFYSITKRAAEDLLISFCKTFKVNYRIIRLCNVLGKGDGRASAKKNALTYMIECLKKNEDVFLYDDGTPKRDVMHVDDVCRAIQLICNTGELNQIYNVGSGNPTQILDIINFAKKHLGSTSNIKSKEAPEFHQIVQTKHFWMDTTKLKNLGFEQSISLEEIIKELCQ